MAELDTSIAGLSGGYGRPPIVEVIEPVPAFGLGYGYGAGGLLGAEIVGEEILGAELLAADTAFLF